MRLSRAKITVPIEHGLVICDLGQITSHFGGLVYTSEKWARGIHISSERRPESIEATREADLGPGGGARSEGRSVQQQRRWGPSFLPSRETGSGW